MSENLVLPDGPGQIPSMRPQPSGAPVLLLGAVTTALALFLVFLAEQNDWNPMGWSADYVIPIGAMLVGLIASSGFGFASWKTGVKINGRLLAAMLVILTVGYACAEWLEYLRELKMETALGGESFSFPAWFDSNAQQMRFVDEHGKAGNPLGMWGYAFRALELLGFLAGGLAIPLVLRSQPFCESCNLYMRKKQLAAMRFDLPKKLIGDQSPERQAERARLLESSSAGLAAIFAASKVDAASLLAAAEQHGPLNAKGIKRALFRIEVTLVYCAGCNRGRLVTAKLIPKGRAVQRVPIGDQELLPSLVEGVLQSR